MEDDNVIDKFEEAWNEKTEEAEDDVMAFTLSFLTVLVIQALTSIQVEETHQEHEEEGIKLHPGSNAEELRLLGFGVIFLVLAVVVLHAKHERLPRFQGRMTNTLIVALLMSFAWCTFYATQSYLESFPVLAHQHVLCALGNALLLSLGCVILIYILDAIADAPWTHEETDQMVITIIGGL